MTKELYLNIDRNKFINQNKAEIMDCVEGCLLDNELYSGKRGYILFLEQYVNCNMSKHKVLFAAYNDQNAVNSLWEFWDNLIDSCEGVF